MVSSRCHNEGSTLLDILIFTSQVYSQSSFPGLKFSSLFSLLMMPWWQISDSEMNALSELAFEGLALAVAVSSIAEYSKHVHGRLVFIIDVRLAGRCGLFLIEREWSKEGTHRLVGWAPYSLPPLDFLTRITFSTMSPSCDSVPAVRWEVGGLS